MVVLCWKIKKKYGDSVDFGWHDAEGFCLVTSSNPELPIGRLVEMENLETISDFLSRNRQAQIEAAQINKRKSLR